MSVVVRFLGLADRGSFETRPVPQLALKHEGIPGDRHAGLTHRAGVRQAHLPKGTVLRNARQLSLLGEEELAAVAQALGVARVAPEWLGGNVVLAGVAELTKLRPSTRLVFPSGACVVVDGDNLPCAKAGRAVAQALGDESLTHRFVQAALGRRGVVGWVEVEGEVHVGAEVRLVQR